jgi:hypothetical protein
MCLTKADWHPYEQLAVDLDDTLVLIDGPEEFEYEFDLREEEMLVLDIPSTDQGSEDVDIDGFLEHS